MSTDTLDEATDMNKTEEDDADPDAADIAAAELEVLRAENERLREQFQEAKRTTYQRTALAFLGVGVASLLGAVLFPNVRVPLVTFGGTGVFAAILTYFITPEDFHAASVSEQIYEATARNGEGLVSALGLQDTRVYVPVGDHQTRLYVPAHRHFTIPADRALESLLVVTGDERERGVSLHPTGRALYEDFEQAAIDTDTLEEFGAQLGDAVVEQFELARSVSTSVSPSSEEARFEIESSSCGDVQDFDQPIVSFLATGLAASLDEPVRVSYPDASDDGIVRCVWGEQI